MNEFWTTRWDQDNTQWMAWACVIGFTLIAAVTDIRSHRIPNALTLPVLLVGLIYAAIWGGVAGLADSLCGALLAMLPFVLMFLLAGGGAGDAKLMAAVGAWVGVIGAVFAVAGVMLAGGLIALGLALWMPNRREVFHNFLWILMSLRVAVTGGAAARRELVLPQASSLHVMPYGLAIFAGCVAASGVVLRWHGLL